MDERDEPNKPRRETPTPEVEHLLKALEFQAAARRNRSATPSSPFQTPSFRYGSLVAIVVFAFGSLGVLEWFLDQLPRPRGAGAAVTRMVSPAPATSGSVGVKN